MTKKNVHKENLSIIQEFVDMVNKDNLLELEYEANDLKVKIVKNIKSLFSTHQETIVSIPDTQKSEEISKSTQKVEKFTNKHPGAVNSPCLLYTSPSPRDPT